MRLSRTILPLLAFVIAAGLSVLAARATVALVETRSVDAVQEELVLQGHDWARVIGDGLQIILEGEAPTEAMRFRAMSIAGSIVDASRVIDNMSVTDTAGIAPPDFAIEILRNDSGVSLIGLIPASTDRESLNAQIASIAAGQEVTDLLQSADYAVPPGWEPALDYALRSLRNLPRSKISVSAGHVAIHAISESESHRRRLEADLARSVPQGVRLGMSISAPRPVITPFTLRFTLDEDGARFDACAADDEEAIRTITAAATAAGMTGRLDCTLALGVPTSRWGEGVAMTIDALAELGGGTVTFSDADIVLIAPEDLDEDLFEQVIGTLSNRLPQVFALDAVLPRAPEAGAEGPPEFTVSLSSEGVAQLRGRVPDELMNSTVANFARARFGNDNVVMATRIAPEGLPQGWSIRVLAGIEALAMLNNGTAVVTPDKVILRGDTGHEDANAGITRLLIEKLGQSADFQINVSYVRELDPAVGLPTDEECIYMIGVVTEGRKITFDPGSATLTSGTIPIIDDIAEVLRRCADLRLRIAGHTDSQGSTEMNLRLSQQRADSVLAALRARRVPVSGFVAVGYGPEFPIADNATEEGREANRRIEFSLILPDDAASESGADESEADEDAGIDLAENAGAGNAGADSDDPDADDAAAVAAEAGAE